MSTPESPTCIVDFCGSTTINGHRVYPYSCSADWDGSRVVFTGAWRDVPDMPCSTEPTEGEVEAWATKHHDQQAWYQLYLNS